MTEISKILSICDHTLLRPEATPDEIKELCDDAVKYRKFDSSTPTI